MNFGTFKANVRRLLDDDGVSQAYTDQYILDALGYALAAISKWLPNESTTQITGDGSQLSWQIADAHVINGVLNDETNIFLDKATLEPGARRGAADELDWVDYPRDTVLFSDAPDVGDTYTVYYAEDYPLPSSDADDTYVVPVQPAGHLALMYYTMATMLSREVMRTALTKRFGDRQQDSGTPEDNPMQQAQRHFMDMFHIEVERLPRMVGRH